MGVGTNNRVEFQALLELLHCAKLHNVDSLQIFGYSKLVIDWISCTMVVEDLELVSIGVLLKKVSETFHDISFKHVYYENNAKVDHLSKEALAMAEFSLSLKENSNGRVTAHNDRRIFSS
jgi:ribonuclease HI